MGSGYRRCRSEAGGGWEEAAHADLTLDFDNPTGTVLTRVERECILHRCAAHKVIVLEDNPHGMFRFEGENIPRMASLDRHGGVLYLATYPKTLCPALRTGAVVVPEVLFGSTRAARALRDSLSQRKSFITVNTSQISQAIVGAVLLRNDASLRGVTEAPRRFHHRNCDILLQSLDRLLGPGAVATSWNRPGGGFFLTVTVPFDFGQAQTLACADRGVIVTPTSFFSLDDSRRREIRLAFSNVRPQQAEEGIERLSEFVLEQTSRSSAGTEH